MVQVRSVLVRPNCLDKCYAPKPWNGPGSEQIHRSNRVKGWVWFQTVSNGDGYQQTTKVGPSKEKVKKMALPICMDESFQDYS